MISRRNSIRLTVTIVTISISYGLQIVENWKHVFHAWNGTNFSKNPQINKIVEKQCKKQVFKTNGIK